MWAAGETTWIPPDAWAVRADLRRTIEPGEKIALAFDGSARRDSTALVAATLDGFVAPVAVWERPQRAPTDWRVSREEVNDVVDRMLGGTYDVLEFACDPYGWNAELEQWASAYGERRRVPHEPAGQDGAGL